MTRSCVANAWQDDQLRASAATGRQRVSDFRKTLASRDVGWHGSVKFAVAPSGSRRSATRASTRVSADRVLRRIKVIDGGGGDVQQVGAGLWVASFGTNELQRISLTGKSR